MTAMPTLAPLAAPRLARGLYLITPDQADTVALLARVEPVLSAAACLQYRNKTANPELRHEQATVLGARCRAHGVPFIVNDDVMLAAAVGADGVHLGEGDGDITAARATLGAGAIIGASCYDDLARAERATAAGADYLAFGACYPSPTKPHARRASPALFTEAKRFDLPLVAIGGLHGDNAALLLAAGADLLAVISSVFDAADPPAAARRLHDAILAAR